MLSCKSGMHLTCLNGGLWGEETRLLWLPGKLSDFSQLLGEFFTEYKAVTIVRKVFKFE